jgi:natural product biosynthesis luciferase-like monooxygenase protein
VRLSVLFFGADDGDHRAKYEDLLAIARTADALGFAAVWTPERHSQPVGQVFPSPTVLLAALAMVTERIGLRAGSTVLPLHHPLRVAEEWALLDNLSGGRAGLSVATGWHAGDFVLAPQNYADRRSRAFDAIGTLRRLWAGDPVEFPDGTGRPVAVRAQPRPVSPALPVWLTTSGNPDTWVAAGRLRTNVLGATVGQTRDELAEKIRLYRDAYRDAPARPDAPERGTVTLMAHTYVGPDDAGVLERVRAPMLAYLRSYLGQAGVSGRDADALGEYALRRYLEWGSLLGSPETCRNNLRDLAALGCDEVACFVDFGPGRDEIETSLHLLAGL